MSASTVAPRPAATASPAPPAAMSGAPGRHPNGLASRFDPRSNSLGLLRLLLAAVVAVTHASVVARGHQPHLGRAEVGSMAVDAFFVLSGFLVTRSLARLGSVRRYAWHRFLRIAPGFWTCLIVTVGLVAPLLAWFEGADPGAVLPAATTYVTANGALYMRDFSVAGLPTGTAQPGVVNGSLWTLFYEASCYVLVAGLAIFGRRRWPAVTATALTTALAGGAVVLTEVTGAELPGRLFWRFVLVFGLGSLAFLVGDRIPMRPWLLVVALIWVAGAVACAEQYLAWAAVPFAYACLYAVVATPWLRRGPRADLSYGLYVYHWPVESLLVTSGAAAGLGSPGYTVVALGTALLLAAASWYLIERPALRLKDIGPGRPA